MAFLRNRCLGAGSHPRGGQVSALDFGKPGFVKIIHADKDFFVLGFVSDDSGYPIEAIKYPVVAWALEDGTLAPYPITLEGVQTENCYILQPDGTVERPMIGSFASVEEWLADQQAVHSRIAGKK